MRTAKKIFYIKVEQEDLLCDSCHTPLQRKGISFEKLPWWNIWTVPKAIGYYYECPLCKEESMNSQYYPKIKDEVVKYE